MAPDERERRRQEALNRPLLRWLDGFFPPEHDPGATFRWCAGDCAIEIDNPAGHDARVAVSMRVSAGQPPASLRVTGDLWDEAIALVPDGRRSRERSASPPGVIGSAFAATARR